MPIYFASNLGFKFQKIPLFLNPRWFEINCQSYYYTTIVYHFEWWFRKNKNQISKIKNNILFFVFLGKSRMKGEKVVTNLVPYGPEKPRSGMVRLASTNQVL